MNSVTLREEILVKLDEIRETEVITNPAPDFRFMPDDIVLFTGEREAMKTSLQYFRGTS